MNKIYSSLSLILLLLTLGSCDSMFDNEIPPHDLVGDNAITNEWGILLPGGMGNMECLLHL